ncbi:hypothetical protein SNE510_17440 [Streptomyces sp. NE5-10]|uniref:hypothetical protein n=1 Tax=Streptomyces sp. NE5-10 TaxID=2759674 RepID=UPI0019078FCB|nr:hypothetical protein [Streptomyces sp. NE5-10]GHJ92225.1 hypothetical protein SNE510_17440 [Streptomyces sp. NE5-10]
MTGLPPPITPSLEPLGVDLVELSGGSYESPAMTGRPADDRAHPAVALVSEPGKQQRAPRSYRAGPARPRAGQP